MIFSLENSSLILYYRSEIGITAEYYGITVSNSIRGQKIVTENSNLQPRRVEGLHHYSRRRCRAVWAVMLGR